MNEICLSCRKHTKCGRAKHETIGCGYYVPMTNEEWFDTLSTEEKAKWLEDKMTWAAQEQGTFTAKGWKMWLKQPHKPIS